MCAGLLEERVLVAVLVILVFLESQAGPQQLGVGRVGRSERIGAPTYVLDERRDGGAPPLRSRWSADGGGQYAAMNSLMSWLLWSESCLGWLRCLRSWDLGAAGDRLSGSGPKANFTCLGASRCATSSLSPAMCG